MLWHKAVRSFEMVLHRKLLTLFSHRYFPCDVSLTQNICSAQLQNGGQCGGY